MADRTKSVQIGDHTFYIQRYPPFIALEVLGDLQSKFAGPFLSVLNGKQSTDEGETTAAMMQAFSKLSASMNGKELRMLAERLLDKQYVSVAINGENPRPLDQGAIGLSLETAADIIQLCWTVVQHNFAEVIARLQNPTTAAAGFLNPSK